MCCRLGNFCVENSQSLDGSAMYCNISVFVRHAVHGGWSEWSMTECEGFCHNGTQEKTRTCTNPSPKYEARNCSGATWEMVKCLPPGCEGNQSSMSYQ